MSKPKKLVNWQQLDAVRDHWTTEAATIAAHTAVDKADGALRHGLMTASIVASEKLAPLMNRAKFEMNYYIEYGPEILREKLDRAEYLAYKARVEIELTAYETWQKLAKSRAED